MTNTDQAFSPKSAITISDSASDFAESSSPQKPKSSVKRKRAGPVKSKVKKIVKDDVVDLEDAVACIARPHDREYHSVDQVEKLQEELLGWFETVREKRGMPWRKRYDPNLSIEEKGQRAYEIWVSEVMLQQTQVATVIAYWKRWIEKWPTIAELAKADIEEVNGMWRGLGYYRRARSLLAGAKTVMGNTKYKGRLPSDPGVLEKEIDGVGRYTAGAICSMAYGTRTPIVDGNIHRLYTRLLALHAPQTAPATIKVLWQAAEELVTSLPEIEERRGIAGDWNQALMELGSQVCKPVSPDCEACVLRSGCKAYAEITAPPPLPASASQACSLCAPIPSAASSEKIPSVSVFPMRKEKKVSRVEEEVVCVLSWFGGNSETPLWLFVKRPETGLLAGLYEPPTTPIPPSSTPEQRLEVTYNTLSTLLATPVEDRLKISAECKHIGSIPHIFSHINMTYHIIHIHLSCEDLPETVWGGPADWLDPEGVKNANIGTGVKKVWTEVYGTWGMFDEEGNPLPKAEPLKKKVKKAVDAILPDEVVGGKKVKKVTMPMMTRKVVLEETVVTDAV